MASSGAPDVRIVLAEFDIDKGNVVHVQYPSPVEEACEEATTVEYLGEQMLPDGAHNLEEDWTVFVLNRPKRHLQSPLEAGLGFDAALDGGRAGLAGPDVLEAHVFRLADEAAAPHDAASWAPLAAEEGSVQLQFTPTPDPAPEGPPAGTPPPGPEPPAGAGDRTDSGLSGVASTDTTDALSTDAGDSLDTSNGGFPVPPDDAARPRRRIVGEVSIGRPGGRGTIIPLHSDIRFNLVTPNPMPVLPAAAPAPDAAAGSPGAPGASPDSPAVPLGRVGSATTTAAATAARPRRKSDAPTPVPVSVSTTASAAAEETVSTADASAAVGPCPTPADAADADPAQNEASWETDSSNSTVSSPRDPERRPTEVSIDDSASTITDSGDEERNEAGEVFSPRSGTIFATVDGTLHGKLGILFFSADDCKTFIRWLAGPRQPLRTPPASPITPAPPEPQAPAFRCLTYVRNQKDPAVRRGAVCKALACVVPSPCPWVCAWRPLLAHALKACFGQDLPGQTRVVEDLHRTLAALYREYSAAAPPALRPFVGRFCVGGAQFQSRAVRCEFRGRAFDLTLPIALTSEEIGLDGVSLRGLVGLFKESTMQILNAIMLEKRVLLLGRLRPVGQIVRWVLSAVMLACPPYHGLLDQRVFPYASLVNMTWMETPAYIAGTVNPLVEVKPGWWDVLCDLDNGKVVIQSPLVEAELNHPQHHAFDVGFINRVQQTIDRMEAAKTSDFIIENYVQDMFRTFVRNLLSLADPTDPCARHWDSVSKHMNAPRVRMWQATQSFKAWLQHKASLQYREETRFEAFAMQLRKERLSENELLLALQDIERNTANETGLLQLLAVFPVSQDSILPLASLVLHPSSAVRLHCVAILQRLEQFPEGQQAVRDLNKFVALAYERTLRKLPPGDPLRSCRGAPPPESNPPPSGP